MNPARTGRTILFLLPFVLIVTGILVAGEVSGRPGGTHVALQALSISAVGALWACLRSWRSTRR